MRKALLGGDAEIIKRVEKLDTIIRTKIGSFHNCFKYEISTLNWTKTEILASGVGIIERRLAGRSLSGEQTFIRIETIVDAKINNAS